MIARSTLGASPLPPTRLCLALSAALAGGWGCGSGEGSDRCGARSNPSGTQLRFVDVDATVTDFWAHPWPSDARRESDRLFLAGFPNPTQSGALDGYVTTIAARTTAFSRTGALYLSFSGALEPSTLPATPRASAQADSSVQLMDVDERSPERGRRIPVRVRLGEEPTLYLPAHHVVVLPPFGVVLRPNTTYALLVTDRLRAAGGGELSRPGLLERALDAGCDPNGDGLQRAFAPLRAAIASGLISDASLRGASVFTTQDAIAEIRTLAASVEAAPLPRLENPVARRPTTSAFQGTAQVLLPSFQHGKPPFEIVGDGGSFERASDGSFTVHHQERAGVSFSIPRRSDMPAEGWPVVLFAHGTGGSALDALDPTVGESLARRGIAVVGYDGVLHGPRDPTGAMPDLRFFNFFNIEAARDNVRQGGADNLMMARLITSGLELDGASVGTTGTIRFDPSRLGYLGHSQGGLVGAPYVAMDPRLKAAVFSGTSGIFIITLLERKDPVDFLGLLRTVMNLPSDEVVDEFHPIPTLMQTFIELADPIAYGPSYLDTPPDGKGRDVLFVEGFKDFASPARGHEALAAATRAPLAPTHHRNPEASDLVGLAPVDGRVAANATSPNGPVTIGLIQYPEQTHFPIYDDAEAKSRYLEFLRSALLDGRAVIAPPN